MLQWLEEVEGLSSPALTVQAQAQSVDDMDEIVHPAFFPYQDTDSVNLTTIFENDRRYVADRREWNQRGRLIPQDTPLIEQLTMVPIESYDKVAEEEQQSIRERALGNEQIYRQVVGQSIPARVDKLVAANVRRVEMDAMSAWANGEIVAKHPQKGSTHTVDLGFGDRVATAGTAWTDSTAYENFLAWLEDGASEMGAVSGVVLRRATFAAIREGAPNPVPGVNQGVPISRANLEQLISDETGQPFRFYILENRLDVFDDGGLDVTRTAVWPAGVIAAVPQGGIVGATYRAPVVRAMELAAQFPNAGIDVRGQTVYYDYENGGRTAVIECQANHLPVPAQRNVWTIQTGVGT